MEAILLWMPADVAGSLGGRVRAELSHLALVGLSQAFVERRVCEVVLKDLEDC